MLILENISFAIEGKKILQEISARFGPGKIHGIIGPNGSGKSTLLKNICRIWEPQAGAIFIQGRNHRSITRKELSTIVTLVPQHTVVSFPVSVYDIVAMGRNPHLGRFEGLGARDRAIIDDSVSIIHQGRLFYSGPPADAFSPENIRRVFEVNVREFRSDATVFLDFYT